MEDRCDNSPQAQAWQLRQAGMSNEAIAKQLDVSSMTVGRWLTRIENEGLSDAAHHLRRPRLGERELRHFYTVLSGEVENAANDGRRLNRTEIVELIAREYGIRYHPSYVRHVLRRMYNLVSGTQETSYFLSPKATLYCGDASEILKLLPDESVDCIVTSPPYYGQRDYGINGQVGLEKHPIEYIEKLVSIFLCAKRVLKKTGSLWVNLGDTYWSGKGQPRGPDLKQKHRRFMRPQDRSGPRPLCTPKQLLLIPHRFAIAMQDAGWIVRNDNVWYKTNPTPDPVNDRCAAAHEYMFHFVQRRKYYFNYDAVAIPSSGDRETKSPPSVWMLKSAPTFKKHIAVFPEELVRVPVLATLPPGGVLLDPFCGSGTALAYALKLGENRKIIGIDISPTALAEAQSLLLSNVKD